MKIKQQIEQILDTAIKNLRQTSFIPFWQATIDLTPREELHKIYRETSEPDIRFREELEKEAALRQYETFHLIITDGSTNYYGKFQGAAVYASLKDSCEWDTALRNAWRDADSPNEWFLSDNALRMLNWLKSSKNTGAFTSENKIGRQAGLRGERSYSKINIYFKELSLKSPYFVTYEKKGYWPSDYKASIEAKVAAESSEASEEFNNPVFSGSLQASNRDSVLDYAQMLKDAILQDDIADGESFLLFKIHSRTNLLLAFPGLVLHDDYSPYDFKQFLSKVRLPPGLQVAATLSDRASEGWKIGAVLEDEWTWDRARSEILKQKQRVDAKKTYGLSSKAAKVFEWILDLHTDEYELDMTPMVEDVAEEQIGIDDLSNNQNSEALLSLLIEEINKKTSYSLRLIPWKYCGKTHHRILVRRDPKGDTDLIRKIRIRGLDKGVNLTSSQVERVLRELWGRETPDA